MSTELLDRRAVCLLFGGNRPINPSTLYAEFGLADIRSLFVLALIHRDGFSQNVRRHSTG